MEKEYKRALDEHVTPTISPYLLIISIVSEVFPTTSGYYSSILCMMMFGHGLRARTL